MTPEPTTKKHHCTKLLKMTILTWWVFFYKVRLMWTPATIPARRHYILPLKIALWSGRYFVANKAKPNTRNNDTSTALHIAAQEGHAKVCVILLPYKANVEATNNSGHTALHIAAKNDHADVVDFLFKNKAEMQAKPKDRWMALHSAESKGHTKEVNLL